MSVNVEKNIFLRKFTNASNESHRCCFIVKSLTFNCHHVSKKSKNHETATRKLQQSCCNVNFELRAMTKNINRYTNFYDIKRGVNVDAKNILLSCFYYGVFTNRTFRFSVLQRFRTQINKIICSKNQIWNFYTLPQNSEKGEFSITF